MYTVYAKHGEVIHLGREGENLVRQIVFDVADWVTRFGPGTVELIAIRRGDTEFYPCKTETEGSTVIWTITNADTANPGAGGKCVLSYHIGDRLAKSETFQTVVTASPGTASAEPPEPYQSWVDQILAAGAEAKEERLKADAAIEQVEAARDEALNSAQAAAQSAQAAKDAANFAANEVAPSIETIQNATATCLEMLQAETAAEVGAIREEGTGAVERLEQVGAELTSTAQGHANRAEEASSAAETAAQQAADSAALAKQNVESALQEAKESGAFNPVRGTDYWTEEDQAAIVADVLAALPVYSGGTGPVVDDLPVYSGETEDVT